MSKSDIKQTREQKLAAKLKENLRRRKAQTRARSIDNDAKVEQTAPQTKSDPQN